ncbi:hypothetical protein VPH35_061519 [Triticum aestivum]
MVTLSNIFRWRDSSPGDSQNKNHLPHPISLLQVEPFLANQPRPCTHIKTAENHPLHLSAPFLLHHPRTYGLLGRKKYLLLSYIVTCECAVAAARTGPTLFLDGMALSSSCLASCRPTWAPSPWPMVFLLDGM